ncbi:hypothetical protein Dimus_037475, partial [Dionaea muscipula]
TRFISLCHHDAPMEGTTTTDHGCSSSPVVAAFVKVEAFRAPPSPRRPPSPSPHTTEPAQSRRLVRPRRAQPWLNGVNRRHDRSGGSMVATVAWWSSVGLVVFDDGHGGRRGWQRQQQQQATRVGFFIGEVASTRGQGRWRLASGERGSSVGDGLRRRRCPLMVVGGA